MNAETITVHDADAGPVPPGGFLTVPEAASVAGLAERTIRRALREDRLAGVNVAGRWTVNPADLPRFARLARRRAAPGGTVPGVGAGTNRAAQSDPAGEPVANGAALVLAADVAALVGVLDTLTGRLEAAEAEIAALTAALATASTPRRGWWSRIFASTPKPAAAEVAPTSSPPGVLDITRARQERADREAA